MIYSDKARYLTVLVAVGANQRFQGCSLVATLSRAIARLAEAKDWRCMGVSRFYRTPARVPMGDKAKANADQADYVNACAVFAVARGWNANMILAHLHGAEHHFGRTRTYGAAGARWQARSLDLDLLGIDDWVCPDRLTFVHWCTMAHADYTVQVPACALVPHPKLHERGFVLHPLHDIAPAWQHPVLLQSVHTLLTNLPKSESMGIHALPLSSTL